jgi:hypothetical protein
MDPQLGEAFITGASSWYRRNGQPACWLWQFDTEERPCTSGRLEGVHLISRQRIRNSLEGALLGATVACWRCWGCGEVEGDFADQDSGGLMLCPECGGWGEPPMEKGERDSIVEAAEWDGRNGALGCEEHHRRFDSHMTPRIVVPVAALPLQMLAFILDWGLEAEAERKFDQTEATLTEAIEIRSNLLTRYWDYKPGAVPA